MADITFSCMHCKQPLEADESLVGQVIDCPTCNGRIQIPALKQREIPRISLPPGTATLNVHRSPPASPESKKLRRAPGLVLFLIALPLLVYGANYMLVGQPVAAAIDSDGRNSGYVLKAHYSHYTDPTTLVLDLQSISSAAPADLFRGVFQSAEALQSSGRRFDRVILARAGKPVFIMKGDDFASIGSEYAAGQNPVYLMRTFPEKLYKPSGESAFSTWDGGWLGVLTEQMKDLTEAGRQWAGEM